MDIKQITPLELNKRQENGEKVFLLDIREEFEKPMADIGGLLIPMSEINKREGEIPRDKEVVVYCRTGNRSLSVIAELQVKFGFTNLTNLTGGIHAWSDEVDDKVRKY